MKARVEQRQRFCLPPSPELSPADKEAIKRFEERVREYFVSGAGGQLRSGDVKRGSALTDKAFDQDMHFMLFEVAGDQLYFQVISRTGETVDAGVLPNQKKKK